MMLSKLRRKIGIAILLLALLSQTGIVTVFASQVDNCASGRGVSSDCLSDGDGRFP